MHLFHRRPLALVCAAFIAASLAGFYFNMTARIAAGITAISAVVCAVVLIFIFKQWRKVLGLMVAAGIAVATALGVSYAYFEVKYMSLQEYVGKDVEIGGVVISEQYINSYSSGYRVRINELNGETCSFVAILDCEYVSELRPGYEFRMTAIGETLGYDGDKSEALRDMADGCVLRLVSSDEEQYIIVSEDKFNIEVFLSALNRKLVNKLRWAVGGEAGDLSSAILLGDRSNLDFETNRNFRRAGASHLLALSGLHLAVVMGICDAILKRAGATKWVRCIVLMLGTVAYLALTGFAVATARAAIMLILVYLSFFFSDQSDPITSLCVAGAVIIAVSPAAVVDVGFWMSCLATLGIILGIPLAETMLDGLYVKDGVRRKIMKNKVYKLFVKTVRYIVVALAATLAANVATAFVVWLAFGEISLWTPVTNFILSPLTMILLLLSVLFFMVGWIPGMAGLLAAAIKWIAQLMLDVSEFFTLKSGAVISLEYDFAKVIIPLMSIALAVLVLVKLRRRWTVILPVPAAVLAFAICLAIYSNVHQYDVDVSYIQRGKSEMMVVSNGDRAMICDLSDGSYSNVRAALDVARANYATEVEAFMLTHYHQRHISSAYRLMCSELVHEIWLPFPLDEREYNIMWSVVYYAEKCGSDVVVYRPGETVTLFDLAEVELMRDYIKRSTHPTLAMRIGYEDRDTVFIGASVIESDMYDAVSAMTPEAEYIIFGVHGPITKKEYSYLFGENLQEIAFANDTVMAHCKLDSIPNATIVRSPQYYKIKFTAEN